MFCGQCGKKVMENMLFCPFCGEPIVIPDQDVPAAASALKADNSKAVHRYYIRHDRMCEHIEPLIDTYEEKDGIYYCISKPLSVEEMHHMGQHRKEKGKEMFFAALAE